MNIDYQALTVEQLQSMSDEEIMQLNPNLIPTGTGASSVVTDVDVISNSNGAEITQELPVDQVNQPEEVLDNNQPPTPEFNPMGDGLEGTQVSAEQSEAPNAEIPAKTEPTQGINPTDTPNQSSTEAEEFYKKVTAPFKASGKEYQFTSAEDVIALAQKGIDYSNKMNGLKPSLKMVKVLEANGITQEDLGLLVDIHNRKPEAIARLVKDADIDLYSVNEDQVSNYAPNSMQMSDTEYAFNDTVETLQNNPVFSSVIGFIQASQERDQEYAFKNPQILTELVQQTESGLFNKVWSVVERERAVGRLQGLSNLEAYDTVGRAMFGQEPSPQPQYQPPQVQAPKPVPTPVATQPQAKPVNTARNAAAAPSTSSPGVPVNKYSDDALRAMSDAEFAKLDPNLVYKGKM